SPPSVRPDEWIVGKSLHRQNPAAGSHDAMQLRHGVFQIEMVEHAGAKAGVERVVGQRRVFTIALKEVRAVAEASLTNGFARVLNRYLADIDPDGELGAVLQGTKSLQPVSARVVEKHAAPYAVFHPLIKMVGNDRCRLVESPVRTAVFLFVRVIYSIRVVETGFFLLALLQVPQPGIAQGRRLGLKYCAEIGQTSHYVLLVVSGMLLGRPTPTGG